ncbi:fam-l protein [Plasmodium malariae]|uniref:Fam-l protein n=1 Tax=Plasmodium malariae TaxID=5858 RepID=A0A1D3JH47_PLAMA|nr:fam-l protein [Plasmodium malariae]SBT85594.1 fam-l protein [Plasmodium malariae]
MKIVIFFKFSIFMFVTWMYYFNKDKITFDNSSNGNCIFDSKLNTKTHRSLGKCRQLKNLSALELKENKENIGMLKKYDISNNEKGATTKITELNGSLLNNTEGYKQANKNKSCIFETKKYSRFESKIFKELDYLDFLKNNRTIGDKTYKKVICKKYGLRFALPILLILFFIAVLMIDLTMGLISGNTGGLWSHIGLWDHINSSLSSIVKTLKEYLPSWLTKCASWNSSHHPSTGESKCKYLCTLNNLFGIVVYFLPFIILGITLILKVVYYHKKVKKYQKIKFRKR